MNVSSGSTQVKDLPIISFGNNVNSDVIRTLEFTKRIYDDEDNEILDDETLFRFRLSLSTTYTTEDYTSTFKLNDDEAPEDSKITFEFTDDAQLLVTNRRNGTVMTGIISTVGKAVVLIFIPAEAIGAILYRKHRRRRQTE